MSRTHRYREIASELRQAINDGQYEAAGMLPSESELSSLHGVSRVTIRRALDHLRSEGLVASRQGFGWFVGADPLRQSLDRLGTIESQIAAAGRQSERRVLRFGFEAAPPDVAELLGDDVVEVVRLNLADGEPFALVTVWCAAGLGAGLSRSDVESTTFVDLLGDRVGAARQIISAMVASDSVAELLDISPGSALLRVRRVTSDRDGQVALVSEHLYPADRTEFEVTLQAHSRGSTGLRLVD